MANLTPEERRALQYWGTIEHATLSGASTTELWQMINEHAGALGYESAGISATAVNRLRTRAVANRQSSSVLGALGPDDRIDEPAIGRAPWERGLSRQNAVPMWQVQFEHITVENGLEVANWRSINFTGSMPRTRRELELAIEEDAAEMADNYGTEHVGIGAYRILAQ